MKPRLCFVAIGLCGLSASGCYTWKTVDNPTAIRRDLTTMTRITSASGERAEMIYGRATALGVEFRSGQLVPWNSISRLEERRFSVLRTAGAVVGGSVIITIPMAFIISGPEAIGLSARP